MRASAEGLDHLELGAVVGTGSRWDRRRRRCALPGPHGPRAPEEKDVGCTPVQSRQSLAEAKGLASDRSRESDTGMTRPQTVNYFPMQNRANSASSLSCETSSPITSPRPLKASETSPATTSTVEPTNAC